MLINFLVKMGVISLFALLSVPLAVGDEPVVVVPSREGMQRIDIIVDSHEFRPNHIVVKRGQPVEITLRSVTTFIPHNFTLLDPESGLDVEADVPAHKDIRVVFTPKRAGSFQFYCDKRSFIFGSHRKKGMEGVLEVRE